jgi:hypothetical protein
MKFFQNPGYLPEFHALLRGMNLPTMRTDSADDRVDAGEAAYVLKALEYVYAEAANKEYPELLAKTLIPVDTRVPSGAESWSYYQWDRVGKAKFIQNYATDFPNVAAFLTRFNKPVAGVGVGYQYTIQDLRAAMAVQFGQGAQLDQIFADTARMAHEMFIDDVAAYGSSTRGIDGFVTHGSIPAVAVSAGGGAWTTALATVNDTNNAIIVADLNKLTQSVEQATLGIRKPDTLILPLSVKPRVMVPSSISQFQSGSLMKLWLEQQDTIKNVFFWSKLDAAQSNSNLTAGIARAMVYKRDPSVVSLVIPQLFEQFPPQARGMAFKVPCHSRIGGIKLPYPLACATMNVGT